MQPGGGGTQVSLVHLLTLPQALLPPTTPRGLKKGTFSFLQEISLHLLLAVVAFILSPPLGSQWQMQ